MKQTFKAGIFLTTVMFILMLLNLAACTQDPAKLTSLETAVAGRIYASLTAAAPTQVTRPAYTPTLNPTDTMTPSPTPAALASVLVGNLYLREGPGRSFANLTTLARGETLAVIGQFQDCSWLKVRTTLGKTGWVNGDPAYLSMSSECSQIPHGTFRPVNGEILVDARQTFGKGSLELANNTDLDGLAVMLDAADRPIAAVYIRARQVFSLEKIADGSYRLYFSRGSDWDGDLLQFTNIIDLYRTDDRLAYLSNGATPVHWLASFAPAPGMMLRTSEVSASEFPSLR